MYGIFTYICLIFTVAVGKYTIHGCYGLELLNVSFTVSLRELPRDFLLESDYNIMAATPFVHCLFEVEPFRNECILSKCLSHKNRKDTIICLGSFQRLVGCFSFPKEGVFPSLGSKML